MILLKKKNPQYKREYIIQFVKENLTKSIRTTLFSLLRFNVNLFVSYRLCKKKPIKLCLLLKAIVILLRTIRMESEFLTELKISLIELIHKN